MVEQQHRPAALLAEAFGFGERLMERAAAIDEVLLLAPRRIENGVAGGARCSAIAIGDDHRADSGVVDVGLRETAERGCGQHAFTFRGVRGLDEVPHRAFRGVHAQRMREQRPIAPRHYGIDLAFQLAQQDVAGELSCLVLIDVRIGLVARDDVAVAHDPLAQVRVQVERDRDRDLGWCDGSDPLQQGAFAIVGAAFDDHGPVQVQEHGVATPADRVTDQSADAIVGGGVHRPARMGPRGNRRDNLRPLLPRQVEESGHRHVCAADGLERIAPDQRTVVPERLPRRGDRRERVRLVLHLRYDELHRAAPRS